MAWACGSSPAGEANLNVAMLVHDMSNNALGRAFSLSLLVEELGWETRVAGPSLAGIWEVLADTPFAKTCSVNPDAPALSKLGEWADVVICVKPMPESMSMTRHAARTHSLAAVLDIDDPDLAVRMNYVKRLHRRRPYRRWRALQEVARLTREARLVPRMVSNPSLQAEWGGELIPHVRTPRPLVQPPPGRSSIRVGFVGTPRPHKGLDVLRSVVGGLAGEGFRLIVTADRPSDAQPWEDWVGTTQLEQGLQLLETVDVVVMPSLEQTYAPQQFPVKLVDAMLAARAIVASDLPPIRWGLGEAGLLVPAGSSHGLKKALRTLGDRSERLRLGSLARQRALEMYTPEVVAPIFRKFLESVAG